MARMRLRPVPAGHCLDRSGFVNDRDDLRPRPRLRRRAAVRSRPRRARYRFQQGDRPAGPRMPAARRPISPAASSCDDSYHAPRDRQDRRRRLFSQACAHSLGIGITDAQFLEGWNAIFAGEMPGIAALLARAGEAPAALRLLQHQSGPCRAFLARPMPTCSAISARSFCHRRSGFGNPTRRPMITW